MYVTIIQCRSVSVLFPWTSDGLPLLWPVEYHTSNTIWLYSVTGSIATFICVLGRDLKRNRTAEAWQSPPVCLLPWRTLVWDSLGAIERVEQTPRWVQRPESMHGRQEMTETPHQALCTLGDPHPHPLGPSVSASETPPAVILNQTLSICNKTTWHTVSHCSCLLSRHSCWRLSATLLRIHIFQRHQTVRKP